MQYIGLFGFRILVFLFRIMPFSVLYVLADGVAFILYKVVGYRKKVVHENLEKSFPKMLSDSRLELVWSFYRHLADILLEGIKGYSISESNLRKRFVYKNPEILDADFKAGKHVMLMPAHYGNWEWAVLSLPLPLKHQVIGVYKPLRAALIEKFVGIRRSRFGLILNPISKTREAMNNPPEVPTAYIMMSDQHPSSRKKAQWVKFLGRDTACLHGADHYARKYNYPVYYMHIERVKRGFYSVEFTTLELDAVNTNRGEITQKYMKELEGKILETPSDWLWSHRRWKYGKE
jgi:KDO2-lipid IV(A) lauroyltransferase